MSRDILKDAARALREQDDAEQRGMAGRRRAAKTRGRVLEELQPSKRVPLKKARWLVPLAALVLTSTAWASGRLNTMWDVVINVPAAPVTAPQMGVAAARTMKRVAQKQASVTEQPSAAVSAAAEDDLPPEPTPPEVAVNVATDPTPSGVAVATTRRQPAARQPAETPASPDVADVAAAPAVSADAADAALYRKAHRAHFGGGSPATALTLWNQYLQRAPRGRFVPEAQYNRAVCLVRMGRRAEAVAAFQPFAQGQYGSYRQQEATKLIEALSAKPASPAASSTEK